MDIAGKKVAFTGRLYHVRDGRRRQLSRAEATGLVEALGATVRKTPSRNVDLIFWGEGSKLDPRTVSGVPILDERALRALLEERSDIPWRLFGGRYWSAPPPDFADLAAIAHADPATLRTLLEEADWDAFSPVRDLPVLRTRLAEIEASEGVGAVHLLATAHLTKSRGRVGYAFAKLRFPSGRRGAIRSAAVSPDGRWLAVTGGDVLEFFEVAAGRLVNSFRLTSGFTGPVESGIRGAVSWSADSRRVAALHDTDVIGVWEPFARYQDVQVRAEVARAPIFALGPNGRSVWADAATGGGVPGVVADVDVGRICWDAAGAAGARPYGGGFTAFPAGSGEPRTVRRCAGWSPDGRYLRFIGAGSVFAVDLTDGNVAWVVDHDGGTAEFSPCGRRVACADGDTILIADAGTGEILTRHEVGAQDLVWSPDGERLAALSYEDGLVSIVAPSGICRLATAPRARSEKMPDAAAFAFSPDGATGVVRTADGAEIWSLADEPVRIASLDAPSGAEGVLWSVRNVFVLIGPEAVAFVRPDGEVIGRFACTPPEGPRPMERGDWNFGGWLRDEPAFVLDERTWGSAFDRLDAVLVPAGRESDVEETVSWSVGAQYAWPLRWGTTRIVHDLSEVHELAVAQGSRDVRALSLAIGLEEL